MDYKQIQELIKMINKSNIGELCIEEKDFKLIIKQKKENAQPAAQLQASTSVMNASQSVLPALPQVLSQVASATPSAGSRTDNLITIKCPMIGTFYRKPSPDKPTFVEVGDDINPGQIICIIEAMKLFNEIESEVSGKIVKILVDDASPVEYDQPLYLVEPL